MNEPQVWTVIGVLVAALFGMMTLMSTMFTRVIRSEIGRLEDKFVGKFEVVEGKFEVVERRFEIIEGRFDAVEHKFEIIEGKFDAVNGRIDNLDRDIQYLMKRDIDR